MLLVNDRVVIVAIDGSEISENVLEWYRRNAHIETDRILLLHVRENDDIGQPHVESVINIESSTMIKDVEQIKNNLRSKMENILQEKQLQGEIMLASGVPGEVIVSVAEQEDADIIVLGNRGTGLTRCGELGTVCCYVMEHISCPVILYKQ